MQVSDKTIKGGEKRTSSTVELAPLELATRVERGAVVVEVCGDVDAYTAPKLRTVLIDAQARAAGLVVVLAGLTFGDSSAVGVLVGALKRARAVRGRMALVAVPEHFAMILRITGVGPLMPGFDTAELALSYIEEASCTTSKW